MHDVAVRLNADRLLQFEVCAAMHKLAESLPNAIDPVIVRILLNIMQPSYAAHIYFQEEFVFSLLRNRQTAHGGLLSEIMSLEVQHHQLVRESQDVASLLRRVLAGEKVCARMLAYMLRGVWQAWRNHLEWEEHLIKPLLPTTRGPADTARVADWLCANPLPNVSASHSRNLN